MSSGRIQPVAPSSRATPSASTSVSAVRTAPFVEPSHHTRSSSVAGPNVHNSRSTTAAYPASGVVGVNSSPSQLAIAVQSGRDVRQCPSLWPRTTSPDAVSIVRSRFIVGVSVDHFVPGAAVNVPPRSGSASRNCRRREFLSGEALDDALRRCRDPVGAEDGLEFDGLLGELAALLVGDPSSG